MDCTSLFDTFILGKHHSLTDAEVIFRHEAPPPEAATPGIYGRYVPVPGFFVSLGKDPICKAVP